MTKAAKSIRVGDIVVYTKRPSRCMRAEEVMRCEGVTSVLARGHWYRAKNLVALDYFCGIKLK